MLIGYARVSKADGSQSLDLQRAALRAEGIDDAAYLYHDFASGVRDGRSGLDSCLRALRKGDVLVVWKLDRLGRNLAHLVHTVQDLSARDVGLRVLAGQGAPIDTTTAAGRLVCGIFAVLAEFERELIRERTMVGLKGGIPLTPVAPTGSSPGYGGLSSDASGTRVPLRLGGSVPRLPRATPVAARIRVSHLRGNSGVVHRAGALDVRELWAPDVGDRRHALPGYADLVGDLVPSCLVGGAGTSERRHLSSLARRCAAVRLAGSECGAWWAPRRRACFRSYRKPSSRVPL